MSEFPNNEPPANLKSAWEGVGYVLAFHSLSVFICGLLNYKDMSTVIVYALCGLPFTQLLYTIPLLIVFKKRKQSEFVNGVLIIMLITFAPLVSMALFAAVGFALCSVILAGSAYHH